jgi:hypothetical protein
MARLALLAAVLALAGCGGDTREGKGNLSPPQERLKRPGRPAARIKPVPCPRGAAKCRSATGRVLYVEARDPDGDGDAHLVLASAKSISGPGITVIDVERSLRPRPLPRPGDLVAAAGPVYRGSYGQKQIEADAIRVRRG